MYLCLKLASPDEIFCGGHTSSLRSKILQCRARGARPWSELAQAKSNQRRLAIQDHRDGQATLQVAGGLFMVIVALGEKTTRVNVMGRVLQTGFAHRLVVSVRELRPASKNKHGACVYESRPISINLRRIARRSTNDTAARYSHCERQCHLSACDATSG